MRKQLNELLNKLEPWQKFIGLLFAIVGALYAVTAWVRSTARDAVLDEKFLASLSARVRPACIFNTSGAIESDLGASEYVEEITVIPRPHVYGFEISVKAKRHLAYAPLVTGLDAALYPQSAERGSRHNWKILLSPQSTVSGIVTEDPMDTNKLHRFKLEILH